MEVKTVSLVFEILLNLFDLIMKIKDMQSEYLVRFIGACLDPPCLVNEYCSKGSLQVISFLVLFLLMEFIVVRIGTS
jgi:hypothetical protein